MGCCLFLFFVGFLKRFLQVAVTMLADAEDARTRDRCGSQTPLRNAKKHERRFDKPQLPLTAVGLWRFCSEPNNQFTGSCSFGCKGKMTDAFEKDQEDILEMGLAGGTALTPAGTEQRDGDRKPENLQQTGNSRMSFVSTRGRRGFVSKLQISQRLLFQKGTWQQTTFETGWCQTFNSNSSD